MYFLDKRVLIDIEAKLFIRFLTVIYMYNCLFFCKTQHFPAVLYLFYVLIFIFEYDL